MGQRTSISQMAGVMALVATASGCAGRLPSQAGAPGPVALDLRGAGASLTRKLASLELKAPALLLAPPATSPVSGVSAAVSPVAVSAVVAAADASKPLVTPAAADAPKVPAVDAVAPAAADPAPSAAEPAHAPGALPPSAGGAEAGAAAPSVLAAVVPPAPHMAGPAVQGVATPVAAVAEPVGARAAMNDMKGLPAIGFLIPTPREAATALAEALAPTLFQDGFDDGLSAWMTRGLGTSPAAVDAAHAVTLATTRARRSTWIKTRDAIDLAASAQPRLKLAFQGEAAPLRAVWETDAGEFPEEILLTPRADKEYDLTALRSRPGRLVLVARAPQGETAAPVLDGVTIYDAATALVARN